MFDPSDCPYLADVLTLWENELPAGRAAEVRAHARACPECRAELEELRQCSSLLRAGDPAEALPAARLGQLKSELLGRAAADVEAEAAPRPRPRRAALAWLPWAGFAAAAAALLVALVVPSSRRSPVTAVARVPSAGKVRRPDEPARLPAPVATKRSPERPRRRKRLEPLLVSAVAAPVRAARADTPPAPVCVEREEPRPVRNSPATPHERVVIDAQVLPQAETPPSGTLTLIATGAAGSSNATRVILRTEEDVP